MELEQLMESSRDTLLIKDTMENLGAEFTDDGLDELVGISKTEMVNMMKYDPNTLVDYTTDINGEELGFRGNPKLKKVGTVLPTTQNHLLELLKCCDDIMYFAEQYFYIVHPDKGKIKIPLRDYQRGAIQSIVDNRFIQLLFPRQSGKCIEERSMVTIRNKTTGEIKEVQIVDLYNQEAQKCC